MTEEQFNAMMAKGLDEAKSGRGVSVDDAFEKINQSIGK